MRTRWLAGRLLRAAVVPLVLAAAVTGLMTSTASAATCRGWTGGQPPPAPGAVGSQLNGVDVLSGCDEWAVGWTTDNVTFATLIEHWTGGSS
jgi:hypothetical protein